MKRFLMVLAIAAFGAWFIMAPVASAHEAVIGQPTCDSVSVTFSYFWAKDTNVVVNIDGQDNAVQVPTGQGNVVAFPLGDAAKDGSVTITVSWLHGETPEQVAQTFSLPDCVPPPPPPPVDKCKNLPGNQTVVPKGYVLKNGECVKKHRHHPIPPPPPPPPGPSHHHHHGPPPLPYTGSDLWKWLGIGVAFIGTGAFLRRKLV